jgi:hypothetical protein
MLSAVEYDADGLGDQFQPGQVAYGGQDVGGVCALGWCARVRVRPPSAGRPIEEIEATVGAALGDALAEVGQRSGRCTKVAQDAEADLLELITARRAELEAQTGQSEAFGWGRGHSRPLS